MNYHKIHAYIRCYLLEQVEEELLNLDVDGFSFCRVKGMGEYANYFSPDPHVEHVRLEMFVPEEQVDVVVEALVDTASTHSPGDGLVTVMPVERIVRIRNHAELDAELDAETPPS